ncbi:inorganic diphosphatase [Candidatus Woesebacteria bacterium]|nr:inorganic diphosphatase [Candidatus Woesebacteria bacterium]MCD8507372.1 inorganic diphosphatase [Candidatus Woesebacteria bacterium]MCD8527159.1 inorganic diphosphatase [Candidatus Woesebacteria bacterium]MCD8546805.1 inorganic diphosphatase [Candidatus Woesebacteria bacterium]
MSLDPQKFIVHIEIPAGSNIKYEVDEETGNIMVDRLMPTMMSYPENYGLIEDTKGKDGDALDVLVFTSVPLMPNTYIKCKLIGMLEMEDEEGIDHKLLAVPVEKVDFICGKWQSMDDVPQHRLDRMKHFFEHYKDLESGKWVKLNEFQGYDEAVKVFEEGQE